MDSNRFIVLLLPEKHSSFIAVQAEEDAVFSENANMFARVLLYTKRVSVRACFLRLSTEKRKQQKRAKCRERDTMGEILMISRWIIFLWCFCFGVKSLSNFLKEKLSVDCPAPENDHNYEAKECNRWSNTKNIERTKRTEEQKKEKKKENHTTNVFSIRHIIFHTQPTDTRVLHNKETL